MAVRARGQMEAALELANQRRLMAAQTRRSVVAGELRLSVALLEPEAYGIDGLWLWDVLLWQPRWGKARFTELNKAAIREGRNLAQTCGGVTNLTRSWLVDRVILWEDGCERRRNGASH